MTQHIDNDDNAAERGQRTEGFAATETRALAEVNTTAMVAQARAAVESRYVMALKRPRNPDNARVQLLRECKRSSFAESAVYEKPIGGEPVRGLSIRFAEAALRAWGNVLCESQTLYDDPDKRIIRITVTDLEGNVTFPKEVTLEKKVERSSAKPGQKVFGTRTNSRGRKVYIVEATEDDMLTKQASAESKALRQAGLRLIPGDILEECETQIARTLADKASKEPDAEKKKVVDAFADQNVLPDQLERYLGHPLALISPAEIVELRRAYTAIRDGEASWLEILEAKLADRAAPPPPSEGAQPTKPASSSSSTADQLKAELAARRAAKSANTIDTGAEPPPTSPPSDGTTGEAPAGDETWTSDDTEQLREELDAVRADLVQLVGKDKADAAWNGTKGPGNLRGIRTKKHAKQRLDAAYALLEAAKRGE